MNYTLFILTLCWLPKLGSTQGFGINLIKVPDDDRSQVVCSMALLRKYFKSGDPLSGLVLYMSLTSASMHTQKCLLDAIHGMQDFPWSIVIRDAKTVKTLNQPNAAVLHEKPQCYFVVIENLEDEDLEDIFEDWKTTLNWNPLAQFVVYLSSIEETDEEMTELMIEILLSFMNKKIYNVNVIGQNEENGYYYGKTVFPYHPDNNCGNRVISIETLDVCDYQEEENEQDDDEEESQGEEGEEGWQESNPEGDGENEGDDNNNSDANNNEGNDYNEGNDENFGGGSEEVKKDDNENNQADDQSSAQNNEDENFADMPEENNDTENNKNENDYDSSNDKEAKESDKDNSKEHNEGNQPDSHENTNNSNENVYNSNNDDDENLEEKNKETKGIAKNDISKEHDQDTKRNKYDAFNNSDEVIDKDTKEVGIYNSGEHDSKNNQDDSLKSSAEISIKNNNDLFNGEKDHKESKEENFKESKQVVNESTEINENNNNESGQAYDEDIQQDYHDVDYNSNKKKNYKKSKKMGKNKRMEYYRRNANNDEKVFGNTRVTRTINPKNLHQFRHNRENSKKPKKISNQQRKKSLRKRMKRQTIQNDSNEAQNTTDEAEEQDTKSSLYLEEIYRALFHDKFPKDLSGCPLVAAYRPWEPYIFTETNDNEIEGDDEFSANKNSLADENDLEGNTTEQNQFNYGNAANEDDEEAATDDPFLDTAYDSVSSESDMTGATETKAKLSGIEYQLLQTIGERLHISIDLQVENRNLYHLFQQLIDGDIEMIIGGIDEDPSISQFVSTTIPYHQDDLTWCVAKARRSYNLFNFLASFSPLTWLLTLVFAVIASYTITTMQKLLKVRSQYLRGYFGILFRVLGIITSQSVPLVKLPTPIRLTFATTFFMGLMFINAYQSFLISTLTTPKSAYQISRVEEIYQQRMKIMGSVENVRHLSKPGEVFKYIREKFQMCYNIEECLMQAAQNERLAVAVSRQHSFYNPRIPRSQLYCFDRNENLYVYLVTMLLPKKFHLLHKINPVIQHVIESGHMQKWARDLDMRRRIVEERSHVYEDAFRSLTLGQVVGSFVFTGAMLAFACLMLILECWVHRLTTRRRRRTRLKIVKYLHRKFQLA